MVISGCGILRYYCSSIHLHAEQDCIALELIYSGGAGQQTMAGLSVCVYVVAAAEPETTFNYDNEL